MSEKFNYSHLYRYSMCPVVHIIIVFLTASSISRFICMVVNILTVKRANPQLCCCRYPLLLNHEKTSELANKRNYLVMKYTTRENSCSFFVKSKNLEF